MDSNIPYIDLKYVLFEYRYSATAEFHNWGRHLFGISLEQPLMTLDGKQPFTPPLFQHPEGINAQSGKTSNPFLWQAPTSNAVLFLGEKWMELHDFVSRTLQVKEMFDVVPATISEKAIGIQHPSWLEHALRLARIRGYWFLYPGIEVAEHLTSIHGELYNVPEEYMNSEAPDSGAAGGKEAESMKRHVRAAPEIQLSPVSLLDTLPDNGYLWPLTALPITAWEGAEVDPRDFRLEANDFELAFKKTVGGCDLESGQGLKGYEVASARDLFCNVL